MNARDIIKLAAQLYEYCRKYLINLYGESIYSK